MARERWGSFSVRDHLNTRALATDVLLYDRLIFPVPPKGVTKRHWRIGKRRDGAGLPRKQANTAQRAHAHLSLGPRAT